MERQMGSIAALRRRNALTGWTNDLEQRLSAHVSRPRLQIYGLAHQPVQLVYCPQPKPSALPLPPPGSRHQASPGAKQALILGHPTLSPFFSRKNGLQSIKTSEPGVRRRRSFMNIKQLTYFLAMPKKATSARRLKSCISPSRPSPCSSSSWKRNWASSSWSRARANPLRQTPGRLSARPLFCGQWKTGRGDKDSATASRAPCAWEPFPPPAPSFWGAHAAVSSSRPPMSV